MKELPMQDMHQQPELPPVIDRRNRDRIQIRIPVRVTGYGLLAETSGEAVCTDLSEGGLAFETDVELFVSDVVMIEFPQKGELSYRCHARLIYRMGRRYGAYFLGTE